MTLKLPRYEASVSIPWERIARALWSVDQFDDWLPDPVFYDDQLEDIGHVVSRVQAMWRAGSIADPDVEKLVLPRKAGATMTGLALPLDARLCAHAVITTLAPRVAPKLRRDKVYGFRMLRGDAQLFDAPGQELERMFDLVTEVARVATGGAFELLDVVAFSASAQPERLRTTLKRCGALDPECDVLRDVAALGGGGLPSIDDAFAFTYNFYFEPVDAALEQQQRNFFRYRDEYFVFDPVAKQIVSTGVSALGLQTRSVARSVDIDNTISTAMNDLSGSRPQIQETLITVPQGRLVAKVTCARRGADDCTDKHELIFFSEKKAGDVFREATQAPLDAVRVLPALRDFNHRRRGSAVLTPAASAGGGSALSAYRAVLAPGRAWLRRVLAAGVAAGASWQAGWAATLLSDLGPLTEEERGLLLRLLASNSIGEAAKVQARIALARSSTLSADRFWTTAVPATDYRRRGMLLAARHLARRNPAPWNALRQAVGDREPQLVQYLTAKIKVSS